MKPTRRNLLRNILASPLVLLGIKPVPFRGDYWDVPRGWHYAYHEDWNSIAHYAYGNLKW